MLNRIMLAQLGKVKRARPVAARQEIRGEVGHEEAEARCEVEGLAHSGVELAEGDVFAGVWEDGVVGERIEHRAGGARVVGAGRCVGAPVAVSARGGRRDDVCRRVGGEKQVEEEEVEVPYQDGYVDEGFGEFLC